MGREGWPSPRPLSRKRRVNSTTEYGKGGDFLCRIPPCRRRICRAPVAAVLATSGECVVSDGRGQQKGRSPTLKALYNEGV